MLFQLPLDEYKGRGHFVYVCGCHVSHVSAWHFTLRFLDISAYNSSTFKTNRKKYLSDFRYPAVSDKKLIIKKIILLIN